MRRVGCEIRIIIQCTVQLSVLLILRHACRSGSECSTSYPVPYIILLYLLLRHRRGSFDSHFISAGLFTSIDSKDEPR